MRLILASASPRRLDLLARIGVVPEDLALFAECDEHLMGVRRLLLVLEGSLTPGALVGRLPGRDAEAAARRSAIIVAAEIAARRPPFAAIEQDELAVAESCGTAGVVQQHQREQSDRLGQQAPLSRDDDVLGPVAPGIVRRDELAVDAGGDRQLALGRSQVLMTQAQGLAVPRLRRDLVQHAHHHRR